MLPVAVARSASGGVAIRYILPVLWMTSRFATWGQWARIKHVMFGRSLLGGRQTTTAFGPVHQNTALGAKSAKVCYLRLTFLFLNFQSDFSEVTGSAPLEERE